VIGGFVLRSAAVWRWPEIDVAAYRYGDGAPLEELRRDRPAPDVLFALYAGPVGAIELSEPGQVLHYGVDGPPPVRTARGALDIHALRAGASPAAFAAGLLQPPEGIAFSSGETR
jgi:hypothetical protein